MAHDNKNRFKITFTIPAMDRYSSGRFVSRWRSEYRCRSYTVPYPACPVHKFSDTKQHCPSALLWYAEFQAVPLQRKTGCTHKQTDDQTDYKGGMHGFDHGFPASCTQLMRHPHIDTAAHSDQKAGKQRDQKRCRTNCPSAR